VVGRNGGSCAVGVGVLNGFCGNEGGCEIVAPWHGAEGITPAAFKSVFFNQLV